MGNSFKTRWATPSWGISPPRHNSWMLMFRPSSISTRHGSTPGWSSIGKETHRRFGHRRDRTPTLRPFRSGCRTLKDLLIEDWQVQWNPMSIPVASGRHVDFYSILWERFSWHAQMSLNEHGACVVNVYICILLYTCLVGYDDTNYIAFRCL